MQRRKGFHAAILTLVIATLALVIAAATLLSACNAKNVFTVSFDTNGGTTVVSVQVEEGETVDSLPITMKDGYNFDGWYTLESLSGSAVTSVTPTEDVKLFAKWVEKGSQIQYTVVLNALSGQFDDEKSNKTVRLIYGSLLSEIEEPVYDGYAFVGWFKDETLTDKWDFAKDKVTEDINLYAKYKLIAEEHDVVFHLNYDGANDVKKSTESGKITYVPERTGYEFRGWWISSGVNGNGDVVLTRQYNIALPITKDGVELYADWAEERTSPLQLEAPVLTLTQDPDNYRNLECSWKEVEGASSYRVVVTGGGNTEPVMERNITETWFNFVRSWGGGSYNISVRANGDGKNNVNSTTVTRNCSYMSLGAVTGFSFDQDTNMLTWYDVANAETYNVVVGTEVIAEDLKVTKCDLSTLQAGTNSVRVVASAENYASTSATTSIRKLRLATPEVNIEVDPDTGNIYLSWERSLYADTYIIKLDNKEIETEDTEYTLLKTNSAWGQKTSLTLSVNAFDSNTNYLMSTGAKEYGLGNLHKLTVSGLGSSYNQKLSVDTYKTYSYKVSFVSNGGSFNNSNLREQTVTGEKALVKPAMSRSGYVFRGWYSDEECKKLYDFNSELTGDLTLYAGWYDMDNNTSSYNNRTTINISTNYNDSMSPYSSSTSGTSNNYTNQVYFVAPVTGSYTINYRNYSSSTSSYYNMYFSVRNLTRNSNVVSSTSLSPSGNYSYTTFTANAGDVLCATSYRANTSSYNYYSTCYFFVVGGELDDEEEVFAPKNLYKEEIEAKIGSSSYTYTVMTGSVIKLSISSPSSYYTFIGWYAGNELISEELECEYVMPNKDVTITPKFE